MTPNNVSVYLKDPYFESGFVYYYIVISSTKIPLK